MGRERRCTFGISCFILEWFSNVAIRFLLSFFSYNIVIVFERCLLCWMPVKLFLSNWTMKKCFCPSMIHTFWSEQCIKGHRGFRITGAGFQYLSLEPGFWIPIVSEIPDSLSCIPDSKAQDSRVPRAKFVQIPISTKGRFWNHRRSHTTITLPYKPNQSNFSDAATCDALRCKGRSAFIQPFRMPVKQR